MVSMVRGLIADPELITKSFAGREAEVRPCIGCNQDCIGGVNKPPPRMGCVVNVDAGWELTAKPIGRSDKPGKVIVAGGGPSGMEAARTARLRGHVVELHEAADALGGNMRFARRAPYRADIGKIVDFQQRELERLGVEVCLNSTVDPALAKARGADHVIVATGAEPRRDGLQRFHLMPVEGAELPHVRSPVDVLAGLADGAVHAVVVDDIGTFQAVNIAEYLLARGTKVTLACSSHSLVEKLVPAFVQRSTVERINRNEHYRFMPVQTVVRITPTSVRLREVGNWIERDLDADLVVFCTASEPRSALHDALVAAGISSRLTGDAAGIIDLGYAIRSGHQAALAL